MDLRMGVLVDPALLLDKQINVPAKRAFHQVSLAHKMAPYPDMIYLDTWIHPTVTSRLVYYKVLYIDLPSKSIWTLLLVQNPLPGYG